MILVLRFLKSGSSFAIYPSSVVHTGVKSFGWENRIAQPSPIHSWKLIVPCVVSAVKSGAVSLMRRPMVSLPQELMWPHHNPNRTACENAKVVVGGRTKEGGPFGADQRKIIIMTNFASCHV